MSASGLDREWPRPRCHMSWRRLELMGGLALVAGITLAVASQTMIGIVVGATVRPPGQCRPSVIGWRGDQERGFQRRRTLRGDADSKSSGLPAVHAGPLSTRLLGRWAAWQMFARLARLCAP